MPCYNEAACLDLTVPPLVDAFRRIGVDLEVVLVDNGSTDGTGDVIDGLAGRGLPVVKAVVARNQGQGHGILTGLRACRAPLVGYLGADGQVDPGDVVRLYRALCDAPRPGLVKARRRPRHDGVVRLVVSFVYNALMRVVFVGVPSRDINCNPKLMPAGLLDRLQPTSRDWFLEAEIVLKAAHLGIPIIEIDVEGQAREAGSSHVRVATVTEFIRNILAYRFGADWRTWRAASAVERRLGTKP
jgi:glycosyltransferase involved in cell wall biosynthesis